MSLLTFDYNGNVVNFEVGATYPSEIPVKLYAAQDRSASGGLQYESLGITTKGRRLVWSKMTKADYDALEDFYINIVNGGTYQFDYTDEYGLVGVAIFVSTEMNFREVSLDRFSGEMTVEFITVPA